MPRAFIKDIAKTARSPELWRERAEEARANGIDLMKPLNARAPINILFRLLSGPMVFRAKYALLALALPLALWLAIRRRNALLTLLCLLPLSQLAVLTLMLNPIERYYFPFEPMMLIGFVVAIAFLRRRWSNGVLKNVQESSRN